MSTPTKRDYRDADRLLRTAIWRTGDSDAALLRCWINDTKPPRRRFWRWGR